MPKTSYASSAAFADHQGRLWFGLEHELIEINQKQMITYGAVDEVGEDLISGIVEDDRGRLFVSSLHAVFEFEGTADSNDRGKWHRLPLILNRDQKLGRIISGRDGSLLIATNEGLIKYRDAQQTLVPFELLGRRFTGSAGALARNRLDHAPGSSPVL